MNKPNMKLPIYLDYNATTPMDPRVLEAMLPYFTEHYGNAASRHHSLGCDAAQAVEQARARVADVIGADSREIVFTSGATESDNIAIKGVALSPIHGERGRHIVTARTEHRAVLDCCRFLESKGWSVTYLPVDARGSLDIDQLADSIAGETVLVTIMHANNETGVVHPLAEIGRVCRERGVLFHSDATQSFGKEPIDVEACHVDLLSLSGHKIYGPKGIGVLYVRRRKPRVRCEALTHGGGHERGVRSGTLNVPGIVGLAAASRLAEKEMSSERIRVRRLRDRLQRELLAQVEQVTVNGLTPLRLANTLNLSFNGISGDELMKRMPDIAVSSSSACTSAALQPSYVLGAMGLSDAAIGSSVRFSLGRFTTEGEIDYTVDRVVAALANRGHLTVQR